MQLLNRNVSSKFTIFVKIFQFRFQLVIIIKVQLFQVGVFIGPNLDRTGLDQGPNKRKAIDPGPDQISQGLNRKKWLDRIRPNCYASEFYDINILYFVSM